MNTSCGRHGKEDRGAGDVGGLAPAPSLPSVRAERGIDVNARDPDHAAGEFRVHLARIADILAQIRLERPEHRGGTAVSGASRWRKQADDGKGVSEWKDPIF